MTLQCDNLSGELQDHWSSSWFSHTQAQFFQIEKLMKYLKAEKDCRTDLEMYVAVLSAQKNTLETDTDKIRNEMKEGWYQAVIN